MFTSPGLGRAHVYVLSKQRLSRCSSKSSSFIDRMEPLPSKRRLKLVPMLVAPFRSRLIGSLQSSVWHSRKPLIFFPLFSSTSAHGPHSPKHLQHVLLVHASGVMATTKRLANLRIRPTPMQDGMPLLHAISGLPATRPHEP